MATLNLHPLVGQNPSLDHGLLGGDKRHTLRLGAAAHEPQAQNLSAASTMTACMKKMKKTHPPWAAENSAMVVILALSSKT